MLYRTLSSTVPVAQNERADILDMLRAFALLGICMANAGYFSLYIFQTTEARAAMPTATLDKWFTVFHFAFVDGKFYSIFSLLFGIGFSIIFAKQKKAGRNGILFFYRRLFVLALFGLVHSFLIWDGDILLFYAVVGILLPLFQHCSDRCLLIWAVALLLSPLLFDLLKVVSEDKWNISKLIKGQVLAMDQQAGITEQNLSNWLLANSSYKDLLLWNQSGTWWGWYLRVDSNRIPKVLAMFLLGLFLGRKKIYAHLNTHKHMIKKVQRYGFLLGVPAGMAYAYFELDGKSLPSAEGLWDTLSYALNVAPLGLAYAATITLWYMKGRYIHMLQLIKQAGRMALTNYLMQSVICVIIYFGIGFGRAGKFGPAISVPVALLIWLMQIMYSYWWFRYFQFGPLEWIWRMLTYGKRLPISKIK